MNAAIYVDAIGRCASEDALLGLLHEFQEVCKSENEELHTMFFRMIYRIPLAAFSPTFALEEKKNNSSNCTMESCKIIHVPAWIWWYLEESDNVGVCNSPFARF